MLKNIRTAALKYGSNGVRSVRRSKVQIFSALTKQLVKVFDSCRIFSKTGSDIFRSVLIYGKKKGSRKKICHKRAERSSS